jgi:hypothetical protein
MKYLKESTAIALLIIAALAVGCRDSPVSTSPDVKGPALAIVDGGHPSSDVYANPDVFFLEPLTDFDPTDPHFDGLPNPHLVPTARICRLEVGDGEGVPEPGGAVDDCAETIDDLAMTYDMTGGFYRANLRDAGPLSPDYHHRIEIFLAETALGALRDLDVDDGPAVASCTDEPFCQVNRDGQGRVGVPIKVIIEVNAACLALDPSFDPDDDDYCYTATLDGGESLVVEKNGETIASATPDDGATLLMRNCDDLRSRGTGLDDHYLGRIDLKTWGECVEIDALDEPTVTGVAELCEAPFLAAEGGLNWAQVDRLTIHRFTTGDDFTFALTHGDAVKCELPAMEQGQAYQFSRMQQFVRAVRRAWRAVTTQASNILQPAPLNACHRGCASSGGFRSSYQVAGPAWWDFDASNPGGDLGTHDLGTVVTARAKVFDSGEFEDLSEPPSPEPYQDLRVAVKLTRSDGSVETATVFSDADGLVAYSFTVEGGTNTVDFEAIGVGSVDDDEDPVNNVQAPTMDDPGMTGVELWIGKLTFTAIGFVPLEFTEPQPEDVFVDAVTGWATLKSVTVCTVGELVDGIPVDSILAVRNNGSFVRLTGEEFPQYTGQTGENGCVTFESLKINKTGAYRLILNPVLNLRDKVVDGEDESSKFNVRPSK